MRIFYLDLFNLNEQKIDGVTYWLNFEPIFACEAFQKASIHFLYFMEPKII